MAGLPAPLYQFDRSAERLSVERPSTLRGPDGMPVDATIEDLSTTGCRLSLHDTESIGEYVMIGLAGVGIRSAQVIWSEADRIGCAFDKPLTAAELETVKVAQTVAAGHFPAPPVLIQPTLSDIAETPKLPVRTRVGIIVGLALASWALVGGIAAVGYMLFAN